MESSSLVSRSEPHQPPKKIILSLKPLFISLIVFIFLGCSFFISSDNKPTIFQQQTPQFVQEKSNIRQGKASTSSQNEILDNKISLLDQISFGSLQLEVENEYGIGFSASQHFSWLDGKHLVEPFRSTNLRVKEFDYDKKSNNIDFIWNIGGKTLQGSSVDFIFEKTGSHAIELYIKSTESGEVKKILETEVISKYVRREIRSLSDEDREKFLDALQTLYQISSEEGKLIYGNDYYDISYFAGFHNALAGTMECDHMHQGLGFLTNHGLFTALLEKTLQSIDPTISVPYWDYTIEGHTAKMSKEPDSSAWFTSPVLQDDWFGMGGPEKKFVTNGRWGYTPMIMNATSLCPITNAYGMLRSQWNLNNIPYVSRYNYSYGFSLSLTDIPTCLSHYQQLKKTTWNEFASSIEGAPHGSVHILIGGSWNTDWHQFVMDMSFSHIGSAFASFSFAHAWRQGQISCPSYCSPGAPPTECKCSCPNIETWVSQGVGVMRAKVRKMAPALFKSETFFYNDNGTDVTEALLRMLCNDYDNMTPFIGEMLTSAAPLDPLFWPMHPTLDRLWHWWRLNELGDPEWEYDESACFGHNPGDILPFSGIFEDVSGPYTNQQVYELLDPRREFIPYVYDTFEWSHCKKEGFPLDLLPTGETDDYDIPLPPIGDTTPDVDA